MEGVVELEFPARPEFVALARLVVSSFAATRFGLADERIDDLKLAISEACTNAIEAQSSDDSERVLVRCLENGDRMKVSIEDQGPGFDPRDLPEHPPITDPKRLKFERGLGIPLIRSLVDEVEFRSSASGTLVSIVMHRAGEDMGEDLDER